MKKFSILSIFLMVVAIAVAVVSCKKDTPNAMLNNQPQASKTFYPEGVDDMNAYLKDFKQKMQTVTRDNEETLSLEEATWYLSSVANYDFCNINVEFTELRYDTLHYHVNVTNGQVALTDLNALYASVANDIDSFYQSLNLENAHFRFIGASISNSGEVGVNLIVTYNGPYHLWHPSDTVYCDLYFDENTPYPAFGFGMTELERVLKIISSHPYDYEAEDAYFVYSREENPLFVDYIDPYGSPNFLNSRIHCTDGYYNVNLSVDDMCYYLCSYHDIGDGFLPVVNDRNEGIVDWKIRVEAYPYPTKDVLTYYHDITITFGYRIGRPEGGNDY